MAVFPRFVDQRFNIDVVVRATCVLPFVRPSVRHSRCVLAHPYPQIQYLFSMIFYEFYLLFCFLQYLCFDGSSNNRACEKKRLFDVIRSVSRYLFPPFCERLRVFFNARYFSSLHLISHESTCEFNPSKMSTIWWISFRSGGWLTFLTTPTSVQVPL